jgi:predicted small secreted protein
MKVVLAVILASVLAACSTVEGMGKDISGAAQWTHEKMSGSKDSAK